MARYERHSPGGCLIGILVTLLMIAGEAGNLRFLVLFVIVIPLSLFLLNALSQSWSIPYSAKIEKVISGESFITTVLGIYFVCTVIFCCAGTRIVDGLTPAEELSVRLHERSKYEFSGSICRDNTVSTSRGRGTCSWHGGVKRTFKKGHYAKSLRECRKEAYELSWVD